MHFEGILPANFCIVTLLSSEQFSQFERFDPNHVQKEKQNIQFQNKIDCK